MKRFLAGLHTVFLLASVSGPCFADPLTITPHVGFKQEYSDNILFSSDNEKSDAITTLSAGLAVKQDGERLDAGVSAEVDQTLYWEYDQLNALDYDLNGRLAYQVSERLGTSASARYAKDSRRDQDADTTGLLLSGERKTASFSLGSDYLFSELLQGDISLSYTRTDIEEEIDADEDNESFGIDLSFNRNLSAWIENTTGILNLSYLHYAADLETENRGMVSYQEYGSDVFQFSTGVSYNITELYNVFCLGGASYTRTTEMSGFRINRFDFPGTEYDSDTLGGVLSAGVNYTDEYYRMNLSLSQDMRGGSGTSGAVQRTSLSGSLTRKMTAELSLTFTASCYLNQNDRETTADTDELTINIQPGFRYRLARDFSLSGIYRFSSVEDREDNTVSERSLVYIMLKKEFEL